MKEIKFETGRFATAQEQATLAREWRARYDALVTTLGQLGTEILVRRTLENDQDIAPFRFVRSGVHEFVFPPQEITKVRDQSGVIDPTLGYMLVREDIEREYNPAAVRGRIRLNYEDASGKISFGVHDLLEDSELPEDVTALLAETEPFASSDRQPAQ